MDDLNFKCVLQLQNCAIWHKVIPNTGNVVDIKTDLKIKVEYLLE